MEETWTVKRILEWIEGYLAQHGDAAPRAAAQWLVADALGVTRMQLYLDPERPLTLEERTLLRDYTRRRGAGEPLQYITGKADFRYITLAIREGVLIPRPETEVLVSEALALLPAPPKPQDAHDELLARLLAEASGEGGGGAADGAGELGEAVRAAESEPPRELLVADLCTGTGCVACSLAHEHPLVRVVATDVAPAAVELAQANVDALGLAGRVEVLACDLGAGVDPGCMGAFDLVVSNPPYVPTAVLDELPREVVAFEPALALDGGADGLAVFRRILDWSVRALKPGGALALELHETSLDDAAAEAEYAGFHDVRIVRDLAGRPRVLTARTRSV